MRSSTAFLALLLAAVLAAGCATSPLPSGAPGPVAPAGLPAPPPPPPPKAPGAVPSASAPLAAPATTAVPVPPTPPPDPVGDAYRLMKAVRDALTAPGEASTVLALARDLTGRLPSHPDSWVYLGWAARRAQSPAVMAAAFRKALEIDGTRTDVLYALAEGSAEAGSPAGAREWLVRAWKDAPGPESARRLAADDISAGRLDEARSVLAAAREGFPGDEAVTADLSAALDAAGNPAHALSVLPLREEMPTRLLVARVSLELRTGDLEGAARDLEKALARKDAGPEATLLLGALKMQRGDLPGAEEQFRKLAAEQPSSPEGHLNLGLALRRQGRFAEARAAYQAGLAAKETPDLHLNLGVLKELYLGDKAGARENYSRFLKLGGAGSDRVRGWLEYLNPAAGSEPASAPQGGASTSAPPSGGATADKPAGRQAGNPADRPAAGSARP